MSAFTIHGEDLQGFNNFMAELITDAIIKYYEFKIITRIINSNYFYFDDLERKLIFDNCEELIKSEETRKKETLYNEISKFLKENKSVVIEGVINFRIREYIKILDSVVDMAVNQYVIEKEYTEFISLLRVYINTTETETQRLHLIYINGESIILDEKRNIISIANNAFNAKYLSDITFSSNDYALNTLLSLLPKRLDIHIIDNEDEFIETLKLIFEERVNICKDCNICKTYKMINNVKILH